MRFILTIFLLFLNQGKAQIPDSLTNSAESTTELLPILSYDTDVGFGYGVKAFALNHLGTDESFDLVLFNSTKGERWYRLVFALPDFEQRQGTVYPVAVDVVMDYDKWIKNSFFGIGNTSSFSNREYYTKEPFELSVAVSRGFTPNIVGQAGLRFKTINNFHFSPGSRLQFLPPSQNGTKVTYASLFFSVRHDTRNRFINPSEGLVLLAEAELAPSSSLSNVAFTRLGASFQRYSSWFIPRSVLAIRFGVQGLIGNDLPVQVLLPVGGNNTLRGFPQDRFLDKTAAVGNVEFRIPIFWRFGGVLGVDAGRVWRKLSEFDLSNWATNAVIGLRFHMDTFIVRLDVGLSKETTGLYLNFGQVF